MTALSFVWVHPYSQNSGCDTTLNITYAKHYGVVYSFLKHAENKFQDCLRT